MQYVRVTSYSNGKFTGCEHLYLGASQANALEKFRQEYPEYLCNGILCTAGLIHRD